MNAPLLVGLPWNAGTSTLVTWARGRVPMRQPELTDAQRAVPAGVLAADTGGLSGLPGQRDGGAAGHNADRRS